MCEIARKLQSALAEESQCDVTLQLQSGRRFGCHRLILSISSSFFDSKLKNEWSGGEKAPEIDCTEFEDDYVLGAVKYMYGIPCTLTADNVENFLLASVFFGIDDLITLCDQFLKANVRVDTVFKTLRLANLNGRIQVENLCYEFIDNNFEDAVSCNEDFTLLSVDLVMSVIQRRSLSVNEEYLFDCLISYCDSVGMADKDMFSDFSKHLSYCSMSLEYFVYQCVRRSFLNHEEQEKLLLYLSSLNYKVANIENIGLPRRNILLESDLYVQRCVEFSNNSDWKSDEINGDRLEMKCNTTLKLKAVDVFGIPSSSFLFNLSIHLADSSEVVCECHGRIEFSPQDKYQSICLKKRLLIQADTWYVLVLHMKGLTTCTYYGQACAKSSTVFLGNGATANLSFRDAIVGSSSEAQGQFYGFVFFGN